MNIGEVKKLVEGASYEDKIEVLENICEYAGDCLENGYLGSSVSNISYDEFGRVEFQSEHYSKEITTTSIGAVLDNSVVIMQVQKSDNCKLLQLYSWKIDGSCYTYLTFDSVLALEKAYNEIKKQNKEFLASNLDGDLHDVGISYRDIMDVKVAIRVQRQEQLQQQEIETLDFDNVETSFVS